MDSESLKELQRVQRNLQFYTSPEFQDFKNSVLSARARQYQEQARRLLGDFSEASRTEVFLCLKVAEELESLVSFIVSNLEQEESLFRRDFDSPPLS